MRRNLVVFFSFLSLTLLFVACSNEGEKTSEDKSADSKSKFFLITLKNSLNFDRSDELVVLTREELETAFGELADSLLYFPMDEKLKVLPAQYDDLDKDGRWDELAFLVDMRAKQEKVITLKATALGAVPKFDSHAQTHFGVAKNLDYKYESVDSELRPEGHKAGMFERYQMEGPGWGNDKVAFRSYFDERNGKGIFGKRTQELYLDRTGVDENYHELQEWGMDILKVGSSLGAGALAILEGEEIVRLGKTEKASYTKISDGPVRALFDLDYEGWKVGKQTLSLKERISIQAGKYYYTSTVEIPNLEEEATLVTGIVNLHSKELHKETTDNLMAFYTHDMQSENQPNDFLGMGLVIEAERFQGMISTPKGAKDQVSDTYAVKLQLADPVSFHFFAGWELSNENFKTKEGFQDYLSTEMQNLENPLAVELMMN